MHAESLDRVLDLERVLSTSEPFSMPCGAVRQVLRCLVAASIQLGRRPVLDSSFARLVGAAPAYADEGVLWNADGSWMDCYNLNSRVSTTGQFQAHDYGRDGTCYFKWTLKWQVPGAAR